MTDIVSPTILNGSRRSQRMGRMKIRARARGQHITRRIHQRRTAISDLMLKFNVNFPNKVIFFL
jgi:hypothetical protein